MVELALSSGEHRINTTTALFVGRLEDMIFFQILHQPTNEIGQQQLGAGGNEQLRQVIAAC
jgi:hypothetical protein